LGIFGICSSGGELTNRRVEEQSVVGIPPVEPIVTRFNVHIAECVDCGKRVQGRHAEQISGALGAAAAIIWTASSKAV